MTTVTLHQLSKRYDDVVAVKKIDLTVASGELVALLGPSGCGKTTTMRMIAGLLAPTAGDIRFNERSVLTVAPEQRGAVMVFQKHLLFPHMTVAENIGFGLKMRGVDKAVIKRRVAEMLALVQLPDYGRRTPSELSGGQQQRVALARALIIEPAVLLLDEPLANLDANLRLEMRQLIRTIQQEMGITMLFVTHDQEEAVMLADRIALMMDGVLLQYDEPRVFYDRPNSAAVARFFRNENFLPGVKRGGQVETAAGIFHICVDLPMADGDVLLTVRPEEIVFDESAPVHRPAHRVKTCSENSTIAVVEAAIYMGAYTQLLLRMGHVRWTANAPTTLMPQVGAAIRVKLPPEHIWLLPA